MQTLEFETDIKSEMINIPKNIFNKIKQQHIKIIMMYDELKEENIKKNNFLDILKNGPKISSSNDNITREWIYDKGEKSDLYR